MTNRGQAMVESLLIGLILIFALSFFLRLMITTQKSFLIDEFVEQALICLVQGNSNCTTTLKEKLLEQDFTLISVNSEKSSGKWIVHISATTSLNDRIEKESELEYENWIQL